MTATPQPVAPIADLTPPYIYLLTDEAGARLLMAGTVPAAIRAQAADAVTWTLADAGRPAARKDEA